VSSVFKRSRQFLLSQPQRFDLLQQTPILEGRFPGLIAIPLQLFHPFLNSRFVIGESFA
jgi:hypothetical protein